MKAQWQIPVWAIVIGAALAAASARAPLRTTAMPVSLQPPESQPVTLTLECVDSSNIRFEITNIGSTDTALRLGSILANGRKYMIDGLHVRLKLADGSDTEYDYWPRDYPVAIAGRLDQWFQAFPVRAVHRMSATAEDFFTGGRLTRFPKGMPLSLRWTISAEEPKSLVPLIYWTGTLISNSCVAP
jgi:hypothetical protein